MKNTLVILILALSSVFLFAFYQDDSLKASIGRGKLIYEANCISCHMADGKGLEGAFPPLANTGRLSDKARLIKNVLEGSSGPITVNGKEYTMEMSAMPLSDEEVRDVLNYVRNSWGNKAPEISLQEVKQSKITRK